MNSRRPSPTAPAAARPGAPGASPWRASRAAFRSARQLQAPARERLNAVLRHYGEAVGSEFGWCMVRAEDQDLSPAMSRHIKQLKSEIDQGIRRLIREGVQDGSIAPCD